MGWGKAIAKWAPSPQAAVDMLVELNNLFALDGFAPPSYGGLLGCLGLFEGPKQENKVLGKISFKPPKSKYAAMPSAIGDAVGRKNVQTAGTVTKCNQVQQPVLYDPPLRQVTLEDYQVRQKSINAERDVCDQIPTHNSTNQAPRKRRWVLATAPSGGTIDLT